MPSSTRQHQGILRARYTEEQRSEARAGIGRGGDLGLDRCTDAQRRFRALLGLYLFNSATGPWPYATSGVAAFLTYSVVVSARYDHLVMLDVGAVDNVVGRLMPRQNCQRGVAGLRLSTHRRGTYHLVHVPTASSLVITNRPTLEPVEQATPHSPEWRTDFPNTTVPLSTEERDAIHLAEALSPSMERLLAGLVVRIGARDPEARWSLWQWSGRASQLWGYRDLWTMEWRGSPAPGDVAAALTDPVFGITGAHAYRSADDEDVDVVLDGSRLRLNRGY